MKNETPKNFIAGTKIAPLRPQFCLVITINSIKNVSGCVMYSYII